MIEQLKEQIKVVARASDIAQRAKVVVNDARASWEEEHISWFDTARDTASAVSEAENTLHELTLQAYAETGDKAPAAGVSVKIFQVLSYDQGEAMKWASEHRVALKLDTSTFEKIAKVDTPGFVTISEEPRAQISRNLEVTNA